MTWIALADHLEQQFSLTGLGGQYQNRPQAPSIPDALLVRGSLMIETRLSPDGRPQDLLNYKNNGSWLQSLSVHAIPGGGITLVIAQNDDITHATVHHIGAGRTDVLRITYAWDAPRRWGRLSVERPDTTHQAHMVEVANTKPLPLSDLHDLILDVNKRQLAEDIVFVAISDRVEPVGPMPTLTTQVPVETSLGYRKIGDLRRGDLVRAEDGALVPVLHNMRRTVPARGSFAPIRLRAPYFGLKQDIIVAPDQRLIIRGSEVEYLFGREAVLVPARHLGNETAALPIKGAATVAYSQLLLPKNETMITAGSVAESLYIGRLRRKPDLLRASLLGSIDRNNLPEHAPPAFPVLGWFDAITLAEHRAA